MKQILTERFFWGLVITLVGVSWLLNNAGIWTLDTGELIVKYWPVIFIYFGFRGMFVGGVRHPSARTYWAIMSGSEDVRSTWDDLSIVNIMGGAEVDLSRAGLPEREVQIDAYSLMGGGDLVVPPGVKVVCEETSLLGGVKVLGREAGGVLDRRVIEAGEGPVVRVRAGGGSYRPRRLRKESCRICLRRAGL